MPTFAALKQLRAIMLEMTFLSALEHFLCTLPASFHTQIVLLVVIGAEFTCIRMLSERNDLNSVL